MFKVYRAAWAQRVRTLVVQIRGAAGQQEDAAESYQPMGLRTNPVVRASTEAMVFELPNGGRIALLIDKARDEGAVEAESGETQLHGLAAQSAVVRIRANGDIEISAASGRNVVVNAAGAGEVRLNGSALTVAADTDPVDLGTWAFVPGTGGASLSYTPPSGAPTPITPAGTPVAGKIHVTAARRVKV